MERGIQKLQYYLYTNRLLHDHVWSVCTSCVCGAPVSVSLCAMPDAHTAGCYAECTGAWVVTRDLFRNRM